MSSPIPHQHCQLKVEAISKRKLNTADRFSKSISFPGETAMVPKL